MYEMSLYCAKKVNLLCVFQPHLPSIFDAIYTVDFDDKDCIVKMNSDNGETIKLEKPVACLGGVEVCVQ